MESSNVLSVRTPSFYCASMRPTIPGAREVFTRCDLQTSTQSRDSMTLSEMNGCTKKSTRIRLDSIMRYCCGVASCVSSRQPSRWLQRNCRRAKQRFKRWNGDAEQKAE